MRWCCGFLIGLWMVAVQAAGEPVQVTAGTDNTAPVVLVLGDSLSAAYGLRVDRGWVSLFEQRLREQGYPHTVRNASISGDTTRAALDRLESALDKHKPSIVIIELGANDGLRGQPLEEMAANLGEIVDLSRRHGASPLLLRMRLPPNYGPAYVEKFVAVYESVGRERNVPLSDFMLEGVSGYPQFIQDDGLHPNEVAQPLILENLWPAIEPLLQETRTAQMKSP
jgi:acyl-CoA thioesterase-1